MWYSIYISIPDLLGIYPPPPVLKSTRRESYYTKCIYMYS